ncbi:MAG: hypothetical protein K8H87_04780 [Pseudorhodoplanes sp.]|nr:MAG: hypothetical protein F9K38_07430 [Pseudorhodoplanes sp.]MBZ0139074.1 hypothetical protein [Pseudorhodoplanes sp.]
MAQNSNSTTGKSRESNPPAFIAYAVSDQGRGRKFWTRLGAVRKHKKGEGFNIYLNVLPIDFDGRIVLLPPKADEDTGEQAQAEDADADAGEELGEGA